MAALKQIKSKIRSVIKTQKVTKAMEAVSAAKMRKAQQRALAGRAYARAAVSILARVAGTNELKSHVLLEERTVVKALYIVITSDKGLAGALNAAVLRSTLSDIKSQGLEAKNVVIFAVGKKAKDFFDARGFNVELFYPNTEIDTTQMREVIGKAANEYSARSVDIVKIAYQNFISTFEQRPTLRTVFPLALSELAQVVADIVPARGVFAHAFQNEVQPSNYTIEPSESDVLSTLLPMLASIFVYHALLETQASEHSARMVAMKSASDKAGEMTHALTLKFNKARQAAITREISEITSGMAAMAS